MIGRFASWAIHLALLAVAVALVVLALGLLFGQLHLRSTSRGEPQPFSRESSTLSADESNPTEGVAAVLLGAPNGDAVPRTRGTEPATTPDPAQEAAVGAPSPTAYGLGTVRHSSGLTQFARRPAATPRPTPSPVQRPSPIPSGPRAGTAGGSRCDGRESSVAFNGLHPIAESWRTTGTAAGKASHMGDGFAASYLALPIGEGYFVRIVGPGGHVEMCSTDAGPDLQMQREGRVADLSVAVFTHVCGVPASMGLCQVTVAILGRAR